MRLALHVAEQHAIFGCTRYTFARGDVTTTFSTPTAKDVYGPGRHENNLRPEPLLCTPADRGSIAKDSRRLVCAGTHFGSRTVASY